MNLSYPIRICAVLMAIMPAVASAASLSIETASSTYGVSDTFVATLRIDNQSECINAAQIELSYPTDVLRAVDFSRGGSILSLWVGEPIIDTAKGTVNFSGGIPGGYCGRTPGDPSPSNILAKVIFSVVGSKPETATIVYGPTTSIYKHDGQGTPAVVEVHAASVRTLPQPTLPSNQWLDEVSSDTIPPDRFTVQIESSGSVFGGKYYIVFSTVDKQSGLDHYEIFTNGGWQKIVSPHLLEDQSLDNEVKVRAVDKAGNTRLGDFNPRTAPAREYTVADFEALAFLVVLTLFALGFRAYLRRGKGRAATFGR